METVEEFNNNIRDLSLKISMLTVMGSVNKTIDLGDLYENLKENKEFVVKYDKNSKKKANKEIITSSCKINDILKKSSIFYNSLTATTSDNNSIKIFPNGSIHITGCKNIEKVYEMFDTVSKILKLDINSKKIILINCHFKHYSKIDQNKLKDIINSNSMFKIATLNLKNYAGLNAKFISSTGHEVTIIVFSTGSVSIFGSKNTVDIKEAYLSIKKILEEEF